MTVSTVLVAYTITDMMCRPECQARDLSLADRFSAGMESKESLGR